MEDSIYYIKTFNNIVFEKMRNIHGDWFLDFKKIFLIDNGNNVTEDIKFKEHLSPLNFNISNLCSNTKLILRLINLIHGLDLIKKNYNRTDLQNEIPYKQQPAGYGKVRNAIIFAKNEGIDCFNDFEGLLSLIIKMKAKLNYYIMYWYDYYINSTPDTEELLKKCRNNLEYGKIEFDFFEELNFKRLYDLESDKDCLNLV